MSSALQILDLFEHVQDDGRDQHQASDFHESLLAGNEALIDRHKHEVIALAQRVPGSRYWKVRTGP
jgi:hypothetical protein